jgi:hypothetical protein
MQTGYRREITAFEEPQAFHCLEQRHVVRAKLIELGLVGDTAAVQDPLPLTLDIKSQ